MNYLKLKTLFIQYKKFSLIGVTVIVVILVGALLLLKSNKSSDIISPKSNIQSRSYSTNNSNSSNQSVSNDSNTTGEIPEYDYNDAPLHIGEKATIKGTVLKVFTSKSNTTFFDFCQSYKDCPFTAVIFASDLKKFGDVKKYEREVKITGTIKSYNGKAEIIIDEPSQID